MATTSEQRLEKLVEVWGDSKSQADACRRAGYKTKDPRRQHRLRRAAEEHTGVTLPAINANKSSPSFWDIKCPSSLDMVAARKSKDFVITSCTNNSPLVKPFLTALDKFAQYREGQLLVVPVRYRNPDGFRSKQVHKWPEEIEPFALTKDLHLGPKLVISSHRLNATSVNPLAGKQALSGQKSAIYGHPQLAMELVGTPKNQMPKVMMTTGSCNRPKYSATDAGGKAKFYHTIYAIYVKVVRGAFYYIQLGWDGTGFAFGNEYWTEEGLSNDPAVANIVHGDSHVWHEIAQISASKQRVNDLIRPDIQVFHDLHDQHIGSHHNTVRERIEMALKGDVFIEDEVRMSIDYIERLGAGTQNYIVGSNHNDHLDQWHNSYNVHKDPANAKFHGWLASNMYGTPRSALETCFDEWGCSVHYEFLDRNDARMINTIDVSQHGDTGTNGARGSAKGFAKTTLKTIIGHSHTPCIEKGCWQVGTSTDSMGYAKGYGTWMLTDCLIYSNGKRALVNHVKGKTIFDVV